MDMPMIELDIIPFTKYVILKVGLLEETKVIDECNIGYKDEKKLMDFKRKYMNYDDCVLVKINM